MSRTTLRTLCLTAAMLGLLFAPTASQAEDTGIERYKVKLLGIETFYGQEKWKTSPHFQGPNQQAMENDAGQYDGAIGYRLVLRIQLTDEAGNNVPADPVENRNVNLTAVLRTSGGEVPAYVQRMPGTVPGASDSPIFRLHFDLDGTDPLSQTSGTPRNKLPELTDGAAYVRISIFKQGTTPNTRIDAGQDDLVFNYVRAQAKVTIEGFGERDYIANVPDNTFRLLNDIGHGPSVPFITEQVPDTAILNAQYDFGIADRTVRWLALTATPCASANCAPINGLARTEIHSREIATAKTGPEGNVTFTTPVKDLLTYGGRPAFAAAIVVVAAVLVPETDLPPELGAPYAKGGLDIIAGGDEFVLAISNRVARVTGFSIDTQLQERAGNSSVSNLRYQAAQVNSLTINLYDDAGLPCTNCGDAVAIVPDGVARVLGTATIRSHHDPALSSKYRQASLLVREIQNAKVSSYRILGLLYGSTGQGENNVFQGLTYADRGYIIETASNPTRITDVGTYYFNITSRTTNYDLRANEPDFRMKLLYRITSANGLVKNDSITLGEGGVANLQIPVSSNQVGQLVMTYEVTSGDTLVGPISENVLFHDQAPRRRIGDRIPGFEAAALVVGVLALALMMRRREAF